MFTKNEKDLLYSLALGDGCIYKYKNEEKYTLSVGHGPKQKDYCEWKMNLLNDSNIFQRKIKLRTTKITDKRNGHVYIQYVFNKGSKQFKEIWEDYHDQDRIVKILNNIHSDRSLAIWFMDDGAIEKHKSKKLDENNQQHYNNPFFHLCTHCFSEDENIYIKEWFKRRYLIEPRLGHDNRKNVQYTYLRFNAADTKKIYQIIRPYVLQIQSMRDKFQYLEDYYYSE